MTTNYIRPALGAALLCLLLAGCDKTPAPEAPAAAPPTTPAESPAPPAEAVPAPSGEVPPADAAEPAPSPSPAPPPPTEPSPVPKPTSAEPALDSMHLATASAKISVPVSLRYQIEGEALSGQPFTLHLAAIPRVAGAQLQVSVKNAPGLEIASGSMQVQKASVATPYRQTLAMTRSASGPENLRVLVTMDLAEGTAFGYFTIPLASGITAHKPESVKQR
jgi:outer membrane biosynthesis protein TonB